MQVELKHTIEQLHEEQERIVKIESIKKSLEIEVKVNSSPYSQVRTFNQILFSLHRTSQFAWRKLRQMPLLELVVSLAS